jgi:hypothetical protein
VCDTLGGDEPDHPACKEFIEKVSKRCEDGYSNDDRTDVYCKKVSK